MTRGRPLLWGIPLLLVLLWLFGLLGVASGGLPEAPVFVRALLPLVTFLRDTAAVVTVGALAMGGVILPERDPGLLRLAARVACVWWGLLILHGVLTLSDILAQPPTAVMEANAMTSFLTQLGVGQVLVAQLLAVACVALLARAVVGRASGAVVSGVALAAAAAPALLGHGGLASGHVAATVSLGVHLAAMSLWVGGLVALLVVVRRGGDLAVPAVARFSSLALVCALVVGESGLLNASLRLGAPSQFVATEYGSLVLVKATLFAGLVLLGWRQRTLAVPRITSEPAGAVTLLRLASYELVIMAAAIAVSVVLGRLGLPASLPGELPFTPVAITVLALAVPFLIVLARPPAPGHLLARYPELASVGFLVVVAEVGAVGVAQKLVGPEAGAVLGSLALVAAGWGLATALAVRSRGATGIAMLGWPLVFVLSARLSDGLSGVDIRVLLATVAVGEALMIAAVVAPRRRVDLRRTEHVTVPG